MVTIEVFASIMGHLITWLYDGEDEQRALRKAKRDLKKKGLEYRDYILV